MALLSIITAPDPRLKITAKPVAEVDDIIRQLMDDMLETMYAAPGVGLAAPQVGSGLRIIVTDCARREEPPAPLKMVNPEVVWTAEERIRNEEGCLSFPEQFAEVERPCEVRVRYLDQDGAEQTIEAEGLRAVCIQHEIDHLDGVLFVDLISRLKREIILRRLVKARKQALDPSPRNTAPVL